MNNEIFQNILDMMMPMLPEEWKKMILYVGYTSGSYSMKFYTADKNNVYTDCFSQKGANKTQLIKLFMDIDKILDKERNALDDKNKWSVMTMIVDNNGKMNTEFDYTDISENSIAYERNWKEKYLR